jgi:hypothetical protein
MMRLGLGLGLTRTAAVSIPSVQPIVLVGASNTAGGDDSAGATLDAAQDENSNVYHFFSADGTIALLDVATGIPRPGGLSTDSTTPGINFAKYLNSLDPNTKYLIVNTAVGGRGVYNGGDVMGSGPWDPDGAGAAWDIGDAAAATEVSGALYKAHTSGNWKTAVDAAIATSFPGHVTKAPIFFGHPCNENDTGGDFSDLYDKAKRCIEGIRTAWGAASAPWVLHGGPPEWTYAGIPNREKITAVNSQLAQRLPYTVFVEGQEENQHPTEDIHNNNAGYRLLGTKCGQAVAPARTKTAAPHEWVDVLDGLTNKPDVAYGLYRLLSTYAGNAIRVSNGTTEADIGFDAEGYLDIGALETHVGANTGTITKIYDQMVTGYELVPEGTGSAKIISTGDLLFQGRRFAWGNDENSIMLKDTAYTTLTAGAILAVGRMAEAANPVMLAGAQSTLAIYHEGGLLGYAPGSVTEYKYATGQEYEPSYIEALPGSPRGYNLYANYVDGTGLRIDGAAQAAGTEDAFSYGSAGLAWGGRIGQTNRYSVGSHVAALAWDAAPTGADLATIDAWAKAVSQVDILNT